MECEDIINKKFNRSFIGYDIGQVDAFLDELYSEMQALKAELEMLRAARQMNSDSKPKHGTEENSKTANRQQNAENKTESASKRVFAPVFFFCIFNIHSCTEKMNENPKKLPQREGFRE